MAKPASSAKPRRRSPTPPLSPYGRSLADFEPLSKAEETLLHACRIGRLAHIEDERPQKKTGLNCVRADVVRFLALGGDERAPVHEHGVQLAGAWIDGVLDLQGARIEHRLGLRDCTIQRIDARQASLGTLVLAGTHLLDGLFGDRLRCQGSIFLRHGFQASGEVRLLGARIEGNLDCENGRFENKAGKALSCDNATVVGSVFLRGADGGRFHSTGEVRLHSTTLGLLDCTDSSFDGGEEGIALRCEGARVSRGWIFRGAQIASGDVALSSMHVGVLSDDLESWQGARGRLILDGFTYDRISGSTNRIAWLELQTPAHLDREFRPQPWEQLRAVLIATGHFEQARAIAIAKHEKMRAASHYVGGSRVWDWLYGRLAGYGYRPRKLMGFAIGIWAACALAYWAAVNPSFTGSGAYLLGPPGATPGAACLSAPPPIRNHPVCRAEPPRYQDFFAPTYSLEVMLPVISLGGKERWQPVVSDASGRPLVWGHAVRILHWLQTAFGWLVGLLLVGVLNTLMKKD